MNAFNCYNEWNECTGQVPADVNIRNLRRRTLNVYLSDHIFINDDHILHAAQLQSFLNWLGNNATGLKHYSRKQWSTWREKSTTTFQWLHCTCKKLPTFTVILKNWEAAGFLDIKMPRSCNLSVLTVKAICLSKALALVDNFLLLFRNHRLKAKILEQHRVRRRLRDLVAVPWRNWWTLSTATLQVIINPLTFNDDA